MGKWGDWPCSSTLPNFLCSAPQWRSDSTRTFQINSATHINTVTLFSIANTNSPDDSLCIDSVSVNGEQSRYISSNWIGGAHTTLSAVVCALSQCDAQ